MPHSMSCVVVYMIVSKGAYRRTDYSLDYEPSITFSLRVSAPAPRSLPLPLPRNRLAHDGGIAYHSCFLSLLTCRDFADCGIAYGRNPNFSHQDYIKRRSKRSSNLDMAVQTRTTVVGGASIDMQREGDESKV